LLDVDPGASTNRTVFTFVGEPAAVVAGAVAAATAAKDKIDMRNHKGAHVRFGAMDVCPFVPVANVTMEDCVECAKQAGEKLAEALDIPIYLYGEASSNPDRKTLKQIREGEYEAVESRITQPEWRPDFGPAQFRPTWGATAVGARDFLIAYNVNLLGTKEQAHRIALNIREHGRSPSEPGRCKRVMGMGWYVDEYNMAQMTFNLEDYKVSAIHTVFEECVSDAKDLGLAVVGSELVGLVPLESMLAAADYYIAKEGLFILEERQKVALAIQRLGLSSISHFDMDKRIVEYAIEPPPEPLVSSTLREFITSVGARTSAPGGGSVAAAVGAMGAALGRMMGLLSYGNRKFEKLDSVMRQALPPLHAAMVALSHNVDADTAAFERVMAAFKLGLDSPEGQSAMKHAVEVPLETMRHVDTCFASLITLAQHGNMNARSDLEVGAKCLETAAWSAHRNVLINLKEITDTAYRAEINVEAETIMANVTQGVTEVVAVLDKRAE